MQKSGASSLINTVRWIIMFPANTKRNKHVTIMSKQRFDVIIVCLLRCAFAGLLSQSAAGRPAGLLQLHIGLIAGRFWHKLHGMITG